MTSKNDENINIDEVVSNIWIQINNKVKCSTNLIWTKIKAYLEKFRCAKWNILWEIKDYNILLFVAKNQKRT